MDEPEYIRRTCLLQAAATLYCSGQIHCGQQCAELDGVLQRIEADTGWNSNKPAAMVTKLYEHYKATK